MTGDPGAARLEIDHELLDERLARVSKALDAHAGGIELVRIDDDGEVRVRFTGMCTGCPLRPVSLNGLVRPVLESVDGVTGVAAEGGRVSREAEARLVKALQESGSGCLVAAITDEPVERDKPAEP
jgi:Fe-S cluster biogenesis protein NfuA